jgi:hypothetical protein
MSPPSPVSQPDPRLEKSYVSLLYADRSAHAATQSYGVHGTGGQGTTLPGHPRRPRVTPGDLPPFRNVQETPLLVSDDTDARHAMTMPEGRDGALALPHKFPASAFATRKALSWSSV